jgi:hypothetical protein
MRNAITQRIKIMIPIGAMRQPGKPHVSHAETGGSASAC